MFTITVTGVDALSRLTDTVVIERRLYDHSRARLTIAWDATTGYDAQTPATLAASALNAGVDVFYNAYTAGGDIPCFHGYVEAAHGVRAAGRSQVVLDCVSQSKRADFVPRYRAWQSCKLTDICRQVAVTEPLISVDKSADMDFDIDLSVQWGETDWEYLGRMLHAWGVPVAVREKPGKIVVGARGTKPSGTFPGLDFHWSRIAFIAGNTGWFVSPGNGGAGPGQQARAKVGEMSGLAVTKTSEYETRLDAAAMCTRHAAAQSQADTACYRLAVERTLLDFAPGDVVAFEGQDAIIRAVRITGTPQAGGTATQEFELQPFALPYRPERGLPNWPARALWAHVVDVEDPLLMGRVQVRFAFESLDPPSGSDRVWLPLVAPYGAGKSPSDGKAASYSGFYAMPEVGERVLVQFLGDWDSDAVVLGTAREGAVDPAYKATETKMWRTPSGNELSMTTTSAADVVRVRCRDKVFFEAKMEGANAEVMITPGESDADMIHLKKGSGPPSLYIVSGGAITVQAKGKLHLEGQTVQVKASGGTVNIDGAPQVLINTAPTPAVPLVRQAFGETTATAGQEKQRTAPAAITAS